MEKFPQFKSQDFTSRQIGHIGLVAGMIDELGISVVIDEELLKTRDHILPHSKVVTVMLLNGLDFNERRLYFFSRFSPTCRRNNCSVPGSPPNT